MKRGIVKARRRQKWISRPLYLWVDETSIGSLDYVDTTKWLSSR
jgi:hypothetical protein